MVASNVNRQVRFEKLTPESIDYRLTDWSTVGHELVRVYAGNGQDRYISLERELSKEYDPVAGYAIQINKNGPGIHSYTALAFDGHAPCPVSAYQTESCVKGEDSFTLYQSQDPNPCFRESSYKCYAYHDVFVDGAGHQVASNLPNLATLSAQYYAGFMTAARDEVRFTKERTSWNFREEQTECTASYTNKMATSAQDQFWQAWNNPTEWLADGQFPVIKNHPAVSQITVRDTNCDGLVDGARASWSNAQGYFEVNLWPSSTKRSEYVDGILHHFNPIFQDKTGIETQFIYRGDALYVSTSLGATVKQGDPLFVTITPQGPKVITADIDGVVQELDSGQVVYLRLVASKE